MEIKLSVEAAHAVLSIGITIAVVLGLYVTKSPWCLLGFIFIPGLCYRN
jgi:hypothetical protein